MSSALSSSGVNNSVLIVAGEASSSLYAQRLLELWKSEGRDVSAFGVGSQSMVDLGFEAIGRSEDLAVVGLQEVIAHWPVIRDTFYGLVKAARERKPKCALLLDYPDFNLRLAKKLKALGIPVVYYISPQLWAWRKGRVKTVQRFVDRMLVVFPFEKEFYEQHNVHVDFVGHPLLDELSNAKWDEPTRLLHRKRYGIADDRICLGIMPGSRRSELKHHLLEQLEAARLVVQANPQVQPTLMVAPSLTPEYVRSLLPDLKFSLTILQTSPFEMIQMADVVLCASGTATLMVGLMEKPMVIMYRMNAITAFFAKLLVRRTSFFGMVNLISGRQVVPELFQERASAQGMAKEILNILDQRAIQEQMVRDLHQLKVKLGEQGATRRVARVIAEYLG